LDNEKTCVVDVTSQTRTLIFMKDDDISSFKLITDFWKIRKGVPLQESLTSTELNEHALLVGETLVETS